MRESCWIWIHRRIMNDCKSYCEKVAIPTRQACEQLLNERFAADSPVVGHSRAVAQLALLMAGRVNDSGCRLDLELIESAALLHDLAKGEPRHAAAGAAMLRSMGYDAVADLVAVHMELPPREGDAIDAADLLFLADKLMEGERFVPLETRFPATAGTACRRPPGPGQHYPAAGERTHDSAPRRGASWPLRCRPVIRYSCVSRAGQNNDGCTVYLLRHGDSRQDAVRRFIGRTDHPLNETGRAQAEWWHRALSHIPFSHICCSDRQRAVETARIIGRRQSAPLTILPGSE